MALSKYKGPSRQGRQGRRDVAPVILEQKEGEDDLDHIMRCYAEDPRFAVMGCMAAKIKPVAELPKWRKSINRDKRMKPWREKCK